MENAYQKKPPPGESILVQFPVCDGCLGRDYDLCRLCGGRGLLAFWQSLKRKVKVTDEDLMANLPEKSEKLKPDTMPESEQGIEEQWRVAANLWVEADDLARELEEKKSIYLAEQKNIRCGFNLKLSKIAAEELVKASPEYGDFIAQMVNARTEANRLRVQEKYLEMKHRKWLVLNARERRERGMY